jgi:hypothetical protein
MQRLDASNLLELCRFSNGNLAERRSRHRHEIAQRPITVSRTVQQLPGNALPRLVVTAMGQGPANLLERNIHVRRRPFVQLFHRSPKNLSQRLKI